MSRTVPRCLGRFTRLGWAVISCLAAVTGLVAAEALRRSRKPSPAPGRRFTASSAPPCHGAVGEGTPDNCPRPLAGDRSLGQLAAFIAKSMPEDKPGTCVGEDAKNVAAHIYDSFYSSTARARNKPARVELSRLTVNQYANIAADLVGGGHYAVVGDRPPRDDPPGLKTSYGGRRRKKDSTKKDTAKKDTVKKDSPVEQIDPQIDFGFRGEDQLKDRVAADEYQIHWSGACWPRRQASMSSIWKPATAPAVVERPRPPLIDAWVRSGNRTEHCELIRLLGGRKYPLRVDFSKGKKEAGGSP